MGTDATGLDAAFWHERDLFRYLLFGRYRPVSGRLLLKRLVPIYLAKKEPLSAKMCDRWRNGLSLSLR